MKLAKQLSRVMLQTMLYDANAPSQQNLLDLHAVHCALGQHLFWRHGRLCFDLATAQPLEVLPAVAASCGTCTCSRLPNSGNVHARFVQGEDLRDAQSAPCFC